MKKELIKEELENRGNIFIESKKVESLKSELIIIIKNPQGKSSPKEKETYFFPTTTSGFY